MKDDRHTSNSNQIADREGLETIVIDFNAISFRDHHFQFQFDLLVMHAQ